MNTLAARTALATFTLLGAAGIPLASCATGVLGGTEALDASSAQAGEEDAGAQNDALGAFPPEPSPTPDAGPNPTLTDAAADALADAGAPGVDADGAPPDADANVADAADSGGVIPAIGLVGQWLCSGNANDTSGSGNDGTATNVSFVTDRHGDTNSACSFDGTTSYISVPDAPSLDVTAAWSMSAWVQPSGFTFLAGIASKYQTPSANGPTFRLSFAPPYTGIDVDESSEMGADAAAGGLLTQGVWSHVAVTVSVTTVLCYVNGALAYAGTAGYEAQANTDPLNIGLDFETRFFEGAIDDVLLYDRVLSPNDVESIYLAH